MFEYFFNKFIVCSNQIALNGEYVLKISHLLNKRRKCFTFTTSYIVGLNGVFIHIKELIGCGDSVLRYLDTFLFPIT